MKSKHKNRTVYPPYNFPQFPSLARALTAIRFRNPPVAPVPPPRVFHAMENRFGIFHISASCFLDMSRNSPRR